MADNPSRIESEKSLQYSKKSSSKPILSERRHLARLGLILAFVLALIGGGTIILLTFHPPFIQDVTQRFGQGGLYIVQQIGTALLLSGVSAAFVRLFILRYYDYFQSELHRFLEADVTDTMVHIQNDIEKQTDYLVNSSSSLEAMFEGGISRIYPSRSKASDDIRRDLTDPNVTQIRLIGISMNDFVLGLDPNLSGAWQILEQYIRNGTGVASRPHLDIKVMIIDPDCLGAHLRSQGELRAPVAVAGRLKTDVVSTAIHLSELESIAHEKSNQTNVSFAFRLYRTPPILFLCWTNRVTYTQQYYFWARRYAHVPIPVMRYRPSAGSKEDHGLHRELLDHFDWIWDNNSISSQEFLHEKCVGLDKALGQAGAVNVFYDPKEGHDRILSLLHNAKKRVYIQGISLHSFFDFGKLFEAIAQLVERQDVDIRVLILDPTCNQAKYRSYREHLFYRNMTFEEFKDNETLHRGSRLYRDTLDTFNNIHTAIMPRSKGNFEAKLYRCAPTCFMLLADDSMLVEQYHYGKILPQDHPGHFPVILGKDMPVVEYVRTPTLLFEGKDSQDSQSAVPPFALLEDHFNFIFNRLGIPLPVPPLVDAATLSS